MFLTMFFKTQNIGQPMHLTMLIVHPYLHPHAPPCIPLHPPASFQNQQKQGNIKMCNYECVGVPEMKRDEKNYQDKKLLDLVA